MLLGLVQALVRLFYRLVWVFIYHAYFLRPEAQGNVPYWLYRGINHCLADFFCHQQRLVQVGHGQNNHKFFTPHAPDQIHLAHRLAQSVRHLLQHDVACGMAVGVIDFLEKSISSIRML